MVHGSAEDGVEAMVAYRRRIIVGAGLLALPLPGTAALDQFAARRAAKDAVHKSHRVRTRDGDIRDVDDTRYGWKVKGRMVVDGNYTGGRYDRYGYRDRNNRYHRWNDRDNGSFTCYIERGRVADLDFSGIRGLR